MSQFEKSSLPGWVKPAALGLVVIAALTFALPWIKSHLSPEKPEKPEVAATPGSFTASETQWATLGFKTVEAKLFRVERQTDGKIAVNDDTTTPVFSPYSGRVTKLIAHAGDVVKKGDPLLLMEASEYVQAQNDLITAIATLAAARTQLGVTEAAEKRQHELYEANGAALKDWQQAQLDLANARAAFNSAEIGLAAVRNRLRILGRSDAEIAKLEASPDLLAMPAEVVVPAPIGGTVIFRQVGPGEYINSAAASGSQIFSIGDLSTLWLIANLREADSPIIHVGDQVEVSAIAFPGRVFTGKVTYVAPTVDPVTRRVTVRAEIKNEDGALKPEMFANFKVISASGAAQSPAVPEMSVVYEGEQVRLWVAHAADKTVTLRQVQIGRIQDGMVEIMDGVKTGETVVTKGALFIDRIAKGE